MNEELFTIEELASALETAAGEPPIDDAYTVQQLRAVLPYRSERTIRRALRSHLGEGRMECVRVPIIRIDGVRTYAPAYRLVAKDE